jgi:hypothetical protein
MAPQPRTVKVVCSDCGLPWEAHTKGRKTAPTADVCVRLLNAEVARLNGLRQQRPWVQSSAGLANPQQTVIHSTIS